MHSRMIKATCVVVMGLGKLPLCRAAPDMGPASAALENQGSGGNSMQWQAMRSSFGCKSAIRYLSISHSNVKSVAIIHSPFQLMVSTFSPSANAVIIGSIFLACSLVMFLLLKGFRAVVGNPPRTRLKRLAMCRPVSHWRKSCAYPVAPRWPAGLAAGWVG